MASRTEEIEKYGKRISMRSITHKLKRGYDRNRLKKQASNTMMTCLCCALTLDADSMQLRKPFAVRRMLTSTFALLFNIKTKDFGKTSHETSKTYNLKYLQTIISSCSSVMFEMPAFFIRENSSLFLLMTNLRSHPSITAYK